MATFLIRWLVTDPDAYLVTYDEMRVWRAADPAGPWTEVTGPGTRIALVSGTTAYSYTDTTATAGDGYAYDFHASATGASTPLVAPQWYGQGGYCTLAEMRDEGLPAGVSDARALLGIARAATTIERVTRQWFEPRDRTFTLDANSGRDLWLEVPIIAPTSVTVLDEAIDLADLVVYNRHLTQGLTAPDDRANPRIAWRQSEFYGVEEGRRISVYDDGARRWYADRQVVSVTGVFGYTDLAPGVVPGETSEGSQVPTSYGETPALIRYAALRLALRYAYPIAGGQGNDIRNQGRLISESTRDQSYSLGGAGVGDNSYGMTGDLEVDNILMGFMAPVAMGVI